MKVHHERKRECSIRQRILGWCAISLIVLLTALIQFHVSHPTYQATRLTREVYDVPSPITLLANRTRKVAFVHIGKAGGNSIRSAFPRLFCRRKRHPTAQELEECFQKHWRHDSPFSNECEIELHMGRTAEGQDHLHNYTTFLFAIRNPVTRAISSFSYLHPNNTKSQLARKNDPLRDAFYQDCFPTLQHWLQTIHSVLYPAPGTNTTLYNETDTLLVLSQQLPPQHYYCQHLAIAVLQANLVAIKPINAHLWFNYRYYYQQTIRAFPDKEILAIRTEHMWQDIVDLDIVTGGAGQFRTAGHVVNANRNSNSSNTQAADTTTRDNRNLCCLLWHELELYQEIVVRAQNWNQGQKWETLYDVWDTCGIAVDRQGIIGRSRNTMLVSWRDWHSAECPTLQITSTSTTD